VDYQNITLSLPKDLLKKAKHLAVEKNTSLSRLLSQHLEELVEREELYRQARQRQLYLMEKGFDMQVKETPAWKRDELHER